MKYLIAGIAAMVLFFTTSVLSEDQAVESPVKLEDIPSAIPEAAIPDGPKFRWSKLQIEVANDNVRLGVGGRKMAVNANFKSATPQKDKFVQVIAWVGDFKHDRLYVNNVTIKFDVPEAEQERLLELEKNDEIRIVGTIERIFVDASVPHKDRMASINVMIYLSAAEWTNR